MNISRLNRKESSAQNKLFAMLGMPDHLLAIDTNAKTVKGQSLGFMTGILYMAPYTLSGVNLCVFAKVAECYKACLYTAGRGKFSNTQNSRLNKAKLFNDYRDMFMRKLVSDILYLKNKADKAGMIPLVRLNGTQDVRWEEIPVTWDGVEYPNIFAMFPEVQFYDYTKDALRENIPSNYDLTFSYSGTAKYQKYVNIAKNKGMRIAVVFRSQKNIPETFLGLPVVPGDDTDIRHLDPQGAIVSLYAKGDAKKDKTGFVVDPGKKIIAINVV